MSEFDKKSSLNLLTNMSNERHTTQVMSVFAIAYTLAYKNHVWIY